MSRRSVPNLELGASMNALAVGFSGCGRFRVTPFAYAPRPMFCDMNALPACVVLNHRRTHRQRDPDSRRIADPAAGWIQKRDAILVAIAEAWISSRREPQPVTTSFRTGGRFVPQRVPAREKRCEESSNGKHQDTPRNAEIFNDLSEEKIQNDAGGTIPVPGGRRCLRLRAGSSGLRGAEIPARCTFDRGRGGMPERNKSCLAFEARHRRRSSPA